MTKVNIVVIDKATNEDITENAEISVKNQVTGNYISKRQDGYYYMTADVLYTVTATIDQEYYLTESVKFETFNKTADVVLEV